MKPGLRRVQGFWRTLTALLISVVFHILVLLAASSGKSHLALPADRPAPLTVALSIRPSSGPGKGLIRRRASSNRAQEDRSRRGQIISTSQARNAEPSINVDTTLAMARAFAKENEENKMRPRQTRSGPYMDAMPEPSAARAIAEGIVEKRVAGGWVVHFGSRRCIVRERGQPGSVQGPATVAPMLCDIEPP